MRCSQVEAGVTVTLPASLPHGWRVRLATMWGSAGPLVRAPTNILSLAVSQWSGWLVRGSIPRGRARQNVAFLNLASEVTRSHLHYILFIRCNFSSQILPQEENRTLPHDGRNIKEFADKSKNCHTYLAPDVIIWAQGSSLSPYLENSPTFFSNTVFLSFPRFFFCLRVRDIDLSFQLFMHSSVAAFMWPDRRSNLQSWRIGMML